MKDKEYGVPEQKKFPLDTRAHVVSAVKFFNYVDPQYEKELARKLIKKIKEYNIKLTPSDQNRFYKYYTPDDYISHHGIIGMKWGVRRYQNVDGSYTSAGKSRYGVGDGESYHNFGTSKSSQDDSSSESSGKRKGLSKGQKIAIGVGISVAAAGIAYAAYSHAKKKAINSFIDNCKNVSMNEAARTEGPFAQRFYNTVAKGPSDKSKGLNEKIKKNIGTVKPDYDIPKSSKQSIKDRLNKKIKDNIGNVKPDYGIPKSSKTSFKDQLNQTIKDNLGSVKSGYEAERKKPKKQAVKQAVKDTVKKVKETEVEGDDWWKDKKYWETPVSGIFDKDIPVKVKEVDDFTQDLLKKNAKSLGL